MSEIKLDSPSAFMVEGDADEFVPNARSAGMHGFVIVVPPGKGGERFLDLLYRITMIYAFMPRLLKRRAKVSRMVEAVMSSGSSRDFEPALRAARENETAEQSRPDRQGPARALSSPPLVPGTKSPIARKRN